MVTHSNLSSIGQPLAASITLSSLLATSSLPFSQSTPTLSARIGEYLYTSSADTLCQTGKITLCLSTSSRVKMESYSRLVQPPLERKFVVRTRMHFEHSFNPCSMLSRKLSPTFSEYWSNQTGH